MQETHLMWKTHASRKVRDCKIFDLYEIERESPEGTKGTFVQLDAPDWVTIIPCIQNEKGEDCFLMVKQYRHGCDSVTLEFPAGTVEKGEAAEHAAFRELLEETGCRPGKLLEIGSVSPNPAFMNNNVTTFVAEGLEYIQAQNLDEHEQIELVAIPKHTVIAAMGEGEYNNGIMMISLAFYLRWSGALA